MQLHVKQLSTHLKKHKLHPVYLISGDVPLLMQETRDAVCDAAYQTDFHQKTLLTIENASDWDQFSAAADNLNLFSEKTLLEIRNPKGKFDDHGTKVLLRYLDNPPPDKLLLIITPKLTSAQQKTRWFKAVDTTGATLAVWPIAPHELPAWIAARLKQAGLNADRNGIQLLAELTEGNLLSTQQAVEKLRLLYPNQLITTKEISTLISDNARFTIFDLTNYALAGKAQRVIRILSGLQFAGTEATLVLWAITREIRTLYSLAKQMEQGQPITQVVASQWQSRKPLLTNALSRLRCNALSQLLQQAEQIDHMIKGIKTGNVWLALETLSLSIAKV